MPSTCENQNSDIETWPNGLSADI